jgi:peptide/nickel transport system permease protein
VGGLVVILLVGIPAGLIAGTRQRGLVDRLITLGTSLGIAIPDFWLAMVLVILFAVKFSLVPAIGYVGIGSPVQWATHLYLPWIALGIGGGATLARQLRSSMIDALDQDYIRTAEAKGLRRRAVVMKHALKNASMVPLTLVGLQFAYLLGGTIILENIFSMPGLGQYFYQALLAKDLPVIQGVTLVYALTFVGMNLIVDVLYGFINPRVRLR